jgi:hypothetical protein
MGTWGGIPICEVNVRVCPDKQPQSLLLPDAAISEQLSCRVGVRTRYLLREEEGRRGTGTTDESPKLKLLSQHAISRPKIVPRPVHIAELRQNQSPLLLIDGQWAHRTSELLDTQAAT